MHKLDRLLDGDDTLNRVLTSTDAAGQTTVYSYDLDGTLHGLTDAKGNAYVYSHNALNRRTRMTFRTVRTKTGNTT